MPKRNFFYSLVIAVAGATHARIRAPLIRRLRQGPRRDRRRHGARVPLDQSALLAVRVGTGWQRGGDIWSLEGGSVSVLARNGWHADSLKSGEHVRVFVQPNKDGSKGGGFLTVTRDGSSVLKIGVI